MFAALNKIQLTQFNNLKILAIMIVIDLSKFVKDLQSEHTANISLINSNGEHNAEIVVDDCGEFYKIQYVKALDGQSYYHVLDVQKTLWDTVIFVRGFIAAVNYM